MSIDAKGLGLREQVLLAALDCCQRDLQKTFTAEELLVHAWKRNPQAWGLRGFEQHYPDSAKLFKELDAHAGKQGIVGSGKLEKVHHRVYRLTPAGLVAASSLRPSDPIAREKAGRELQESIKQILEHPVFRRWLQDPPYPKHFRDAGHFWDIAAGMPSKTVRKRVAEIEDTLAAAQAFLSTAGVSEVTEQRGKLLFEREDINRALEFQGVLKQRFARDLRLLDPATIL